MGSRSWVKPAVLALLIGDALAQQAEVEPPAPDLLEFLGSWEQPADANPGEFVDLLDVWDSLLPTRADEDE